MKRYQYCVSLKLSKMALCVLVLAFLSLGCQSNVSYQRPSETDDGARSALSLAPGDTVEVKFYYTPELNEVQTIRPDGKIALQRVGEVQAEGLSPAALRAFLLDLYKPLLNDPEIVVLVRSLQNRRVFVGGQVMTPGTVQMPGEMTVLDAIMQAGGFDMRQAEVRNVVVIRHKHNQRYGYSVNLEAALAGDETRPFFLQPQDIVYVPRTAIAKVDQWVDQHINKIIPRTGFIFTRTLGKTTVGVGTYY